MKKILLSPMILLAFPLLAQDTNCNCQADFLFIQQKIEKEHPGFKLNVTRSNKAQYDALVQVTAQKTGEIDSREACAEVISEYLAFIKDKHLGISANEGAKKAEANLVKDMRMEILDIETSYVRLPTFFKSYWQEIDAFYDEIIPKLAERPKLIIDLQNNTGGGQRQYDQLLKFLKKRKNSPEAIAIIYNRYCASACEQFVMKMKKSKKVTTYGENSYGAFAYGFVMQEYTPNCQLRYKIPTKKFNKYMPYEYDGIPPDVPLDKNVDWLVEVKKLLAN